MDLGPTVTNGKPPEAYRDMQLLDWARAGAHLNAAAATTQKFD